MLVTLLAVFSIVDTPELHNNKLTFDIPAGLSRITLMAWLREGDVQGIFSPEPFADLRTRAVRGVLTPCEALSLMIEGTEIIVLTDNGKRACLEVPPHW